MDHDYPPMAVVPLTSAAGLDQRLTRSWHFGAEAAQGRKLSAVDLLPPRLTRSFSCREGPADRADLHGTRTFGGIERRPRPTLPSVLQRADLNSFADEYQQLHRTKPYVVAFVNSRSGGQTGGLLMRTLQESIGREEDGRTAFAGCVCDLSLPDEPRRTIDELAQQLEASRAAQPRLLVCGGDGTVTWILTALEGCGALQGQLHRLPMAVVPLGTGNDLARSLGWGASLRAVSDVLEYLKWVAEATPVTLDQWRLVLRPHGPLREDHKLHLQGSHPQRHDDPAAARELAAELDEALGPREEGPHEAVYVGFWQNYFSVGMDAKVARHVDNARNLTWAGGACFRRGCGKLCYAWQGLLHSCCSGLLTDSLEDVRTLLPDGVGGRPTDLEPPLGERLIQGRRGRLRQLMLVNINSYGAGLDVQPTSGGVLATPRPGDGVVEVLGVRNAASALLLHASRFLPCGWGRPEYLTSSRKVAFRLTRGEFMQLDGEPWRLDVGCDVLVEPHRKLTMLCAPDSARFWGGHISRAFWQGAADAADP